MHCYYCTVLSYPGLHVKNHRKGPLTLGKFTYECSVSSLDFGPTNCVCVLQITSGWVFSPLTPPPPPPTHPHSHLHTYPPIPQAPPPPPTLPLQHAQLSCEVCGGVQQHRQRGLANRLTGRKGPTGGHLQSLI